MYACMYLVPRAGTKAERSFLSQHGLEFGARNTPNQ